MKVEKNILVPYTPKQMYELVDHAEDYPTFLPWCAQADIISRTATEQVATLHMSYLTIKQKFTTKNVNDPYNSIQMHLVEGPFKKLYGLWKFTPVGDVGCRIEFSIEYEFTNAFFDKIIGPVFSQVSNNLVDAFIEEAEKRFDDD
ncbi:type II toxin-antitoxin system RatA family toxin [Neisseria sp. Ec49-e6-T10]|uniref:type II toxin-antitoxin system RatA family toxin n=1 Tax=Neisseria sp. Ec49-e6-T10 TaxID=3140744 RepID=UPI003EBEBD15